VWTLTPTFVAPIYDFSLDRAGTESYDGYEHDSSFLFAFSLSFFFPISTRPGADRAIVAVRSCRLYPIRTYTQLESYTSQAQIFLVFVQSRGDWLLRYVLMLWLNRKDSALTFCTSANRRYSIVRSIDDACPPLRHRHHLPNHSINSLRQNHSILLLRQLRRVIVTTYVVIGSSRQSAAKL
jgi:hypothetical protein